LAKDTIWGVRKGCVDNLIGVAGSMGLDVRVSVFVPMFEQLTKDISRWVRNGAYEVLGPFLATLDSASIAPDLLKKFAQIPTLPNAVVDPEVGFCCAFNFPAVLLTVGAERWSELSEVPCGAWFSV
jgi:serine/threonine-protein phosphatase 4 regulatory subunit 1